METLKRALTQEQAGAIIEIAQAARRFAELVAAHDISVHVDITQKGWVALTPVGEIIVATRDYLIRLAQIIERRDQASASVHSLFGGSAKQCLN